MEFCIWQTRQGRYVVAARLPEDLSFFMFWDAGREQFGYCKYLIPPTKREFLAWMEPDMSQKTDEVFSGLLSRCLLYYSLWDNAVQQAELWLRQDRPKDQTEKEQLLCFLRQQYEAVQKRLQRSLGQLD